MEPRAHHILVGIFTLVIAIAAIGFSLWLAKSGSDRDTKNYTVVFNEPVRGLSRGAAVQYNGIRIGEITKLALDLNDISRVLASITIQSNIPVRENTQARSNITGITGSAVIELTGSTPDSPLLKAQDPDHPPYIIATPSPISQIMSGGEDLMTNLSELIMNANAFLSSENADNMSKSVAQLELLLSQLADGTKSLPELVEGLTSTSHEAEKMLSEVRVLLAKEGSGVFANANEVMKNLNATTLELTKMINDNSSSINQGSQGFAQLAPIMQELRQTVSNINIITQEIQNSPKGFLFGADSLQEFQP